MMGRSKNPTRGTGVRKFEGKGATLRLDQTTKTLQCEEPGVDTTKEVARKWATIGCSALELLLFLRLVVS